MDKKRSKLTNTKEYKSNEDYSTSITQAPSTSKTNASLVDADFYGNLNDRKRFPNVTSVPVSKRGIYGSGATSLPIDLNDILQTQSFYHSEDSETDRPTETGFEITIPNHEKIGGFRKEAFLEAPEEQSRNVIGRETSQQTQISKRIVVEAAPRERKRWVRPPLVGQSTSDSTAVSHNNSTVTASRADDFQDLKVPQTSSSTENIDSFMTLDRCKPKTFSNTADVQSSYFNPAVLGNSIGLHNDMDCGALAKPQNSYNAASDSQNQGQDTITSEMDVTGASGCGRAPSPASISSVTSSRRLEWDSGADVGYQAYRLDDGENIRKKDLSTLERMALARGPAPLRVEPEGIDGSVQRTSALPPKNASYVLRTPVAVSTPIERDFNIAITSNSGTDSESEIMPIVRSHKERFFFSGSEKNDSATSFSKDVNRSQTPEAEASSDVLSRKISSSLTDLSECGTCEEKNKNSNSLPRSQSHLNLMLEPNLKQKISTVSTSSCPLPLRSQHKKNNGRSASSSSIATVVPKYESPRMSDKRTQTSVCNMLDRNSIGIQVCEADNALKLEESDDAAVLGESDLGGEESDSDIINNTENDIDARRHILLLKGTYSKNSNYTRSTCLPEGSTVNANKKKNSSNQCHTSNTSENNEDTAFNVQNKSDAESIKVVHTKTHNGANEKCISTVDSRASSAGSWIMGSVNGNFRRDSSGVVGSANSFEYLPGDIYENNRPTTSEDKNFEKCQVTEDSSSQSDLLCESDLKTFMFANDAEISSLKKDLQKGTILLKELLNSKCYSSSVKKKLVRLLVNRIVETDYAEDCASVQSKDLVQQKTEGGEEKIMEREEISGESAGEQQQSAIKPQSSDKSVGTELCERSASSSSATECTGHSDTCTNSRVETTTTTSSSVNTTSSGKGSWRDFATQSERVYERSKHNSNSQGYESVLLKVCETERENQLSWISTEINHLNNLKQILEKQRTLSQRFGKDQDRRGNERLKRSPRKDHRHFRLHTNMNSRSVSSSIQNDHKKIRKHRELAEGNKYAESLRPSDLEIQELLVDSQNDVCVKKKDVSSQIPSTSDSDAGIIRAVHNDTKTPDSLVVSTFSTLELTADTQSDVTTTGRINVYPHTVKNPNAERNVSSRNEMKTKDALCCCECKKLINEVKRGEIMIGSKSDVETEDKIKMKESLKNSRAADTSTASSSGTIKSVAKGLLKPNRDPMLTHKKRSVLERLINMTDRKCPCCGCLEGETSSQLGSGDWKCARCVNQTIRKCYVCGFNVMNHDASPKVDITWKCDNCLKRKSSKCNRCGKVQQINNENEAERQNSVIGSSQTRVEKSPVGYVLTLESSTLSDSSVSTLLKEPLQETKMRVPVRKTYSFSSNEKVREKSKKSSSSKSSRKENKRPEKSSKHRSKNHIQERGYTLQEYLVANRPDFIENAEHRRQCLDEIAYLRELRQNSKHKILAIASHPNIEAETNTEKILPLPLAVKRIFSQRSMRAQTERKYHNLPEVLSKKAERKRKEDYRTNRLMAEIFAKKLQKKVLKGEVNLSNSRSVISIN